MNQVALVNQNQVKPLDIEAISALILNGDLSKMTSMQKVEYYNHMCDMLSISAASKPFDYLTLTGKQVLYANKGCAEQLRSVHKIGIKIVAKERLDDIFIVTAEALAPNGRTDSATGAVSIVGLRGEALANAMMKAETKAKRRVTLSICGLNMLDESEIGDVSDNEPVSSKLPQPTEEETANARALIGYTFPFGSFKMRTPKQAFEIMGRQKLENAMNLIDEKLINGTTYKGVTTEDMIEAKRQIEKVITEFENTIPEEPRKVGGFVVQEEEYPDPEF